MNRARLSHRPLSLAIGLFSVICLIVAVLALSGCARQPGSASQPVSNVSGQPSPTPIMMKAANATAVLPSTATTAPMPTATAVPTAPPEPTATSVPLTATAAPPSPSPMPFKGTRGPVEVTHNTPPPVPQLVAVRAAKHDGFDRIAFEFKGAVPGYRVEYTKPPILADASGLPVDIAGDAFLTVRFWTAAAHNDDGKTTSDTRELKPGFPSIVEAEQTGDFEAVLTWVLGLEGEADFVVRELQNPSRVVVDVGHP